MWLQWKHHIACNERRFWTLIPEGIRQLECPVIISEIYGKLPRISNVVRRRRLALAGHVSRHDEPAGKLLFWIPEENRRIGRPNITLRQIIEDDTGLSGKDLATAMSDRDKWRKDYVCFT